MHSSLSGPCFWETPGEVAVTVPCVELLRGVWAGGKGAGLRSLSEGR